MGDSTNNNPAERTGLQTADVKATDASSLNAAAELYSLEKIYEGLANPKDWNRPSIYFTDAEKVTFEKICLEELKRQNNLQLVGLDNLGANAPTFVQLLFAFIQIVGGKGGALGDLGDIGDRFSTANTGAKNLTLKNNINDMTTRVYDRMRAAGGNLANAADLVTGWSQGEEWARDMGKNSLIAQLNNNAKIPEGTANDLTKNKILLAATDVATPTGNGLPDSTRPRTNGTQSLTLTA